MKIAITGGTGFVGRHLAQHLLSLGHRPILLARGRDLRHAPAAPVIHMDLSDSGLLAESLRGCDAVAHCAGINRETASQTYQRIHIQGTRNVIEAARIAGISRVLMLSFLRARPDCGSPYHESKFQAEELLRRSGLDYTILKAGMIYGRGDHMLDHLSHMLFTLPLFATVGFREQPIRPVAIHDVTRIIAAALTAGRLSCQTAFVVGPETLLLSDAVRRVAAVLNRQVVILPAPVVFHRMLAAICERTMAIPLVACAQVQMLAEGFLKAAPAADALPDDMKPQLRFHVKPDSPGAPRSRTVYVRGSPLVVPAWALILPHQSCGIICPLRNLLERGEHLGRPHYRTVFAVEIRQAHGVDFACRAPLAVPILAPERECGIFHKERFEAQIPGHPHRGLHRIIGDHARDHQCCQTTRAQPLLQIGADKGAVGLLGDHRLSLQRESFRFEFISGLPRAIGGLKLLRIVTDVIDRLPGRPPRRQQGRDFGLGAGIVAHAPTRIVDRLLQVDQDQGGAVQCHRPPPGFGNFLAASPPENVIVTSAVCAWAFTFMSALVAPRPSKRPSSLYAVEEVVGIVGIQRLAFLHRPDAIDFGFAIQLQPTIVSLPIWYCAPGSICNRDIHDLFSRH